MSGYFEDDLARPLDPMTLHLGDAEAKVNSLLVMLRDCDMHIDVSPVAPLGQKIVAIALAVGRLACAGAAEDLQLLEASKELIEHRNFPPSA